MVRLSFLSSITVFSLFALVQASNETLSRRKRWLTMPKGSSLQLVYCWLISTYGTEDQGIFTVGITVGIAWEIPVNLHSLVSKDDRSFHDRDRRSLYKKLETFINKQGDPGLSCIHRAICESKLKNGQLDFADAMMHAIFNLETESTNGRYVDAVQSEKNCSEYQCSFSVFKWPKPKFDVH